MKTATASVSVSDELFHFILAFTLFSGRCHTTIAMDVFLQEPTSHSHAPNPNRIYVIRIQNGIRERSESSEEATSVILHNALRAVPLNVAADLPSTSALEQSVRRQRPHIDLDINSQLPLIVKRTDRGEDFVLHEDKSMIIFTSKSNLKVLKECQHWFCDGTFSVSVGLFCIISPARFSSDLSRGIFPIIYIAWFIQVSSCTISLRLAYWQKDRGL